MTKLITISASLFLFFGGAVGTAADAPPVVDAKRSERAGVSQSAASALLYLPLPFRTGDLGLGTQRRKQMSHSAKKTSKTELEAAKELSAIINRINDLKTWRDDIDRELALLDASKEEQEIPF